MVVDFVDMLVIFLVVQQAMEPIMPRVFDHKANKYSQCKFIPVI